MQHMTMIRRMEERDIEGVAKVHADAFIRQLHSLEWISCNFKAYPRIKYFVAVSVGEIIGYIQWIEKSGFREEVVLELEQIAVASSRQGKGVASALITQSLPLIRDELTRRGARLKHILVTTRDDNPAKKLYAKTLKAIPEATIRNLFSADEVLMITRNVIS